MADIDINQVSNGLIPKDELDILKPASEVAKIAEKANLAKELQSVAVCINLAANSGAMQTEYNNTISDFIRNTLESQSYKITRKPTSIYPDKPLIIDWSQEDNG